jgi:hypothetical protein
MKNRLNDPHVAKIVDPKSNKNGAMYAKTAAVAGVLGVVAMIYWQIF